jgi:hypothetical protein
MQTALCLIHQGIDSTEAHSADAAPKTSQQTASMRSGPNVTQEEIAELIAFFGLLESWE